MRGNSQNGGQTTKSLLTKPQCSGVPIQQAVSLSSSFPRHCLLFVCAFFREMQESAGSEKLPLHTPVLRIQNRPGFLLWKPGRFVCLICAFWGGAHAKPWGFLMAACAGDKIAEFLLSRNSIPFSVAPVVLWVSPAYAGKRQRPCAPYAFREEYPRYAGIRFWATPLPCHSGDHPRICGEKVIHHR